MKQQPILGKAAAFALAAALAALQGCVLATSGLDYNHPMLPATQSAPAAPAQ